MANTTFTGPVRSEDGFDVVSKKLNNWCIYNGIQLRRIGVAGYSHYVQRCRHHPDCHC